MSAVRKPRVPVEGAVASDSPRLAIHTEELNPDRLLSYYRGSGEVLDVESPPGAPDAFARDGRRGLAFSIPLDGDSISYRLARQGLGSGIVDVIVLPDRLIVANATSVRFMALARD